MGVFSVGLFALGAVWWIVATESGTSWLIHRLTDDSQSVVSIGRTEGTLLQNLAINEIRVRVGADEVHVERIETRVDLAAILNGLIDLQELDISETAYLRGVAVPTPNNVNEATSSAHIRVQQGSLQSLTVVSDEREIAIGATSFGLVFDDDRVTFNIISTEVEQIELQGRGELNLGSEIDLSANFDWATEFNGLRYEGGGSVMGAIPALQLRQELTSPVQVVVTGELIVDEAPTADVRLTWVDLEWPGIDAISSPSGDIQLVGWRDSYEFEAIGQLVYNEIPANLSVEGSGTPSDIIVDTLALTAEHGNVDAGGQIVIEPLSWSFDLDAQNLDPGYWVPEWQGDLQAIGELSGRAEPTEWALSDTRIDGVLREQAVTAQGSVTFQLPDLWQLDDLTILVSGSQISLDGTLGREMDVSVLVDAPDINSLWPGASGQLMIDGHVAGTFAAPELSGRIDAQDLAFSTRSVQLLKLEGAAILEEDAPVNISLEAADLVWGDVAAQSLVGSVSGTSDEHSLAFDIESDLGAGRVLAEGRWMEGAWSGRVNSLDLEQPSLGSWALTAPADVSVTQEVFELQSTCIQQLQSEVCGSARLGTEDDFLSLMLSQFDIRALQAFYPDEIQANGLLNGQMLISAPLTDPEGTVNVSGDSVDIQLLEGNAQSLPVPVERLDFEAQLSSDQLEVGLDVLGAGDTRLSVDASVLNIRSDDPEVSASVNGAWPDMAVLSILSPDVDQVSGTAALDMTISGTMSAPQIQGQAKWSDGSLASSRWGLLVENIQASASSPDGSILEFVADGLAGEGPLSLTGSSDLGAESWPTRLTIRGESIQAVRTPDAEVFVSPQLEVDVALPDINVTGSLLVPRAQVILDEVPAQAVTPSADSVVHGAIGQQPALPLNVHADIEIVLGEDVTYSGSGLTVDLAGGLGLVYDSERNAVATGSVSLLGSYEAYGQTLNLERGELLFAGPLDNPGLDVRAVRTIEPITVGVQLAGTVKAPTTQIFSSPAMSEADALSYLLFGRPLSASGDGEATALEGAALSMGLRQALPAIERVGQTLGLDELTVRATAADTGELMAGKQISPRVYIRYSYGMFNRIGGLLMQFRLTDRFSLETRSGDYRSMDLIYTVERD